MRFDSDNYATPNETMEIFRHPVPFKFRPIESYFQKTGKPTKKPQNSLHHRWYNRAQIEMLEKHHSYNLVYQIVIISYGQSFLQ
jgi:hypothetical protein